MKLFVPFRRATLLIPSGPNHDPDRNHLFIVLTDPPPQPNANGEKPVLLVSLSSVPQSPAYHDTTCVLHPGDHPFIKRESYVNYARARIEPADKLIRGVQQGKLNPRDTLDSAIFTKIVHGLFRSRHTPLKVVTFYELTTNQS